MLLIVQGYNIINMQETQLISFWADKMTSVDHYDKISNVMYIWFVDHKHARTMWNTPPKL